MNEEDPTKQIRWYSVVLKDNWCFLALGIILFTWTIWVIQVTSGINLLDSKDESTPLDIVLQVAITSTLICSPIAIYRYWRSRGVMQYGIETTYRVVSTSLIKYAGHRDIWIEYEFNRKVFKKKVSIYSPKEITSFRLLVNPKRPKHILVLD